MNESASAADSICVNAYVYLIEEFGPRAAELMDAISEISLDQMFSAQWLRKRLVSHLKSF